MTFAFAFRSSVMGFAFAMTLASIALPASGQVGDLKYFVAPTYPPLARRAMISGKVTLKVTVAPDGKITDMKDDGTGHPFLLEEARAAISQWEFEESIRPRQIGVTIYFAFSGRSRESDPTTALKADFAGSSIRVFITTDGVTTVHP